MKPNIHPEYNETVIKCACGNEIKTRSTVKDLRVYEAAQDSGQHRTRG